MMRTRVRRWFRLLITASMSLAQTAQAEAGGVDAAELSTATSTSPWYGSLGLGWNYADELKISGSSGRINYDIGLPAASFALGRTMFQRWRVELGISHQENEPEILYFRDSDIEFDTLENDRFAATSVMANVYRDFQFGTAFEPYLGFGIGPAKAKLRFTEIQANGSVGASIIDDEGWTFAYQAIAGVTIPIMRHIDLGLDYRYWRSASLGLEDTSGNSIDSSQAVHSGWLQLRYRPGASERSSTPHPARSQKGFYLAASAGGGWGLDAEVAASELVLDAFAIGPAGSLAVGYQLDPHWRIELEAARRSNNLDVIDYGTGVGESRTTGKVTGDSLIFNAIYRLASGRAISPTAGVGLGISNTRYDIELASSGAPSMGAPSMGAPSMGAPFIKDSAIGPVFQWMLGFDIALSAQLTFTAGYQMWIGDRRQVEQPDQEKRGTPHITHTMLAGFRYSLAD